MEKQNNEKLADKEFACIPLSHGVFVGNITPLSVSVYKDGTDC